MNKISTVYYNIGEWIIRLFKLHLFWIFFTFTGLIVFGVFPATSALFYILRNQLFHIDDNRPIHQQFWSTYKKDFIKVNFLSYTMLFIGIIFYSDLHILNHFEVSTLHSFFTICLYIFLFLYFIIFIYLFPIYSHFQLKTLGYLKYSFILALAKPLQTLLLLFGLVVLVFFYTKFPGIVVFLGITPISLFIMKVSSLSLQGEELVHDGAPQI